MTALPTLGVTLGDVAGIGPEITAKTLLQHPELREISPDHFKACIRDDIL